MKHFTKDRDGEREVVEYITQDDIEKSIMAALANYGIVYPETKPDLARAVFAELYSSHMKRQENKKAIMANVWRVVVTAGLTGLAIAIWEYIKKAANSG